MLPLTVLFVLIVSLLSKTESSYKSMKGFLEGRDLKPTVKSSRTLQDASILQCAAACNKYSICESFSYRQPFCDLFDAVYSKDDLEAIAGWLYYKIKRDVGPAKLSTKLDLFSFGSTKTWADAKKFCETKNGHMVSIINEAIQKKVEQLMEEKKTDTAWIGLQSIDRNGTFQWLDGTKIHVEKPGQYINTENNFQKWFTNRPSGYKDYDAMSCRIVGLKYNDQKYTWDDESPSSKQPAVICEITE